MSRSFDAWIEGLSERSGYEPDFLYEMWENYVDDMFETNDQVDFDYFAGVTLERDW